MPLSRFLAARRRATPLASLCAVCHGWGAGRLCATCTERFAAPVPRCRQCALQVPAGIAVCGSCLVDSPPYTRTITAVDYQHPWDSLITRYKFHAALDLVPAFVALMRAARQRDGGAHPAMLLPIPLSDARLRERGYNQAWELARRLAREPGCTADARLLLRVRDTPHQLALPPEERAGNVHAAFAIEPARRAELAGRDVTLVDDVMTTGATVAEAARTLLQAGAREVNIWVLARTPRPDG